jgi:hypothetical protein
VALTAWASWRDVIDDIHPLLRARPASDPTPVEGFDPAGDSAE